MLVHPSEPPDRHQCAFALVASILVLHLAKGAKPISDAPIPLGQEPSFEQHHPGPFPIGYFEGNSASAFVSNFVWVHDFFFRLAYFVGLPASRLRPQKAGPRANLWLQQEV